jgi:outer membrane protein
MMRGTLWFSALLMALALPVWAELKIAVFDATEVMANTNAAKRAAGALEGRVNAAQARINALEKPLLAKQKQLQEQKAVMADDKFQAARAEFGKELNAFRQQAQEIQGGLESENTKLRRQITDGVRTVVGQLAAERKYDLILPKALVFHSSANVPDVTDEVLKRANALLDK